MALVAAGCTEGTSDSAPSDVSPSSNGDDTGAENRPAEGFALAVAAGNPRIEAIDTTQALVQAELTVTNTHPVDSQSVNGFTVLCADGTHGEHTIPTDASRAIVDAGETVTVELDPRVVSRPFMDACAEPTFAVEVGRLADASSGADGIIVDDVQLVPTGVSAAGVLEAMDHSLVDLAELCDVIDRSAGEDLGEDVAAELVDDQLTARMFLNVLECTVMVGDRGFAFTASESSTINRLVLERFVDESTETFADNGYRSPGMALVHVNDQVLVSVAEKPNPPSESPPETNAEQIVPLARIVADLIPPPPS